MTSKSPEFQQRLRWSLGVNLGKLTALVMNSLLTAFCWWIVFHDRRTLQEEVEQSRAQYQVKAEYRQEEPRRGSLSKAPVRNSYRRTVSQDVYNIPLGHVGEGGQPAPHHSDEGYTRQTSLDTTYNVPSIMTEISGPVQARFHSIAEIEGEVEGEKNDGFLF